MANSPEPPQAAPDDRALDPLILEAVRDVDQSLLDWALALSPRERLRASHRAAVALGRFHHDPSQPG